MLNKRGVLKTKILFRHPNFLFFQSNKFPGSNPNALALRTLLIIFPLRVLGK